MSTLSIHAFFFDLFSIRIPDVKTEILAGGGGNRLKISALSAFCSNNIDVESCPHTLGAAFCAYQPD